MENASLDFSQEDFKQLLEKSSALILNQFQDLGNSKGYHDIPQPTIEKWFSEAIPEEGMDPSILLEEVASKVLGTATGNLGPHMYAYVMSGGNQMALLAEQLATTINQNQPSNERN